MKSQLYSKPIISKNAGIRKSKDHQNYRSRKPDDKIRHRSVPVSSYILQRLYLLLFISSAFPALTSAKAGSKGPYRPYASCIPITQKHIILLFFQHLSVSLDYLSDKYLYTISVNQVLRFRRMHSNRPRGKERKPSRPDRGAACYVLIEFLIISERTFFPSYI